jgi:hypothetical protein
VIPRQRIQSIALFALILAVAGCGQKTEQAAQETIPPETEAVAVGQPMTFSWDASSSCLRYNPSTVHVQSGSTENFNTSTADTVWVTAPAGCFSAAETTFAVVRGQNDINPSAHTPGSYQLSIRPVICSAATGGPGPSVIVDSGMGESSH